MNKKIDPYIKEVYGIDEKIKYEILEIEADVLLTFSRLDIIAKVLYLENKSSFDKQLYCEHIKMMTKGSCVEAGNPEKKSINRFCKVFTELKNSIEENDYDTNRYLVPVDRNMQILDGAHRVATALFLKKKVPVIKLNVTASDCYDYAYFENAGMDQIYLDAMVLKYISLKKDIFIANVWPTAQGNDSRIKELIEVYGKLGVYKKVFLSEEGAFNYLHQIYAKDDWVGSIDNDFSGVYRKLVPCFQNAGPIRVFVFQAHNRSDVLDLKQKIRDVFQIEKHSVHITDTPEEAIIMGQLLFQTNSIEFMNGASITKYKASYKKLQRFWEKNENFKEKILITGSIIMALYGLCEANDVDYLTVNSSEIVEDSHNNYIQYYGKSCEELMFNPVYHFFYMNHKYLTLRCLEKFKQNRNEVKDKDDLRLIMNFLDQNKNNPGEQLKIKFIRKKRRAITNLQGMVIKFTHKTGTYNWARNLYHKIRR